MHSTNQGKRPEVAILLAVYNGISWLEAQVASILTQADVNISLFISIDPSSDGSEQWCATLAQEHSCVTVIAREQSLQSATQNFFHLIRSVDFSHFDYVAFSDQDDIWLEQKISVAVNRLKNSDFDGYSSNVEAFWENGKKELIDKAQKQTQWDHFFEAAGPGCTYVMSNRLICAIQQRLIQSKALSEKLCFHDWFCYAFAREYNYRWFIDSDSYLQYRQHADNVVGANQGLKAFLRRVRHVLSGAAIEQSKEILAVLCCDQQYSARIKLPNRRFDYIKLGLTSRHCRRRLKDQFFFFALCSIMSVYANSAKN